jgi:protein-S-isoprenylcysteine O-methyltransferase Ste14
MPGAPVTEFKQPDPQSDALPVRLGGWLFRRRTWLPLPLIAALLLCPPSRTLPGFVFWIGVLLVAAGEWTRLEGVRHIGVISRTRSDRLGPLVSDGPFARVRNPLYLGNIALWVGFALSARLAWLAPLVAVLLFVEYHAIVRWEEQLLASRLGERYRIYAARVPRWIPKGLRARGAGTKAGDPALKAQGFTWRDTLFSERGTLAAIAAGYALLWIKSSV